MIMPIFIPVNNGSNFSNIEPHYLGVIIIVTVVWFGFWFWLFDTLEVAFWPLTVSIVVPLIILGVWLIIL